MVGTFFSTVGGLLIGFSQYIALYYFSEKSLWAYAPPQWPIIVFGALAGFLGSVIDSLMGATLQYSGKIIVLVSYNINTIICLPFSEQTINHNLNHFEDYFKSHASNVQKKKKWSAM